MRQLAFLASQCRCNWFNYQTYAEMQHCVIDVASLFTIVLARAYCSLRWTRAPRRQKLDTVDLWVLTWIKIIDFVRRCTWRRHNLRPA